MHQTFYIDVDEEISSVIDRLRKSMAVDNYFVAPKRAIFLQSIVNLKLLKREAEKMKKRVILVTQEEVVAAMAIRSGIDVQSSTEGLEEILDSEKEFESDDFEIDTESFTEERCGEKSVRLSNVGSNDFYGNELSLTGARSHHNQVKKKVNSKNSSLVGRSDSRVLTSANNTSKNVNLRNSSVALTEGNEIRHVRTGGISARGYVNQIPNGAKGRSHEDGYHKLNSEKEKILERLFLRKEEKKSEDKRQISNTKTKNFSFVFIMVCIFLLAGVAGYLYIPSANIVVRPNVQATKIDLDINAGQSQNSANMIAVHVINHQEQLTLQYSSTGKSASSGKKAQGTVVIYNEFDNQDQTLVATTRLQAENGKIFRLLKTVVVPGVSNVAGQVKPGAISAEVVADEPGSEYNIQVGKFLIPGFQGGPKYEKFYAKSSEAMSGGTTEGSAVAGISQGDIENAKQKTETAMKEKISSIIKEEMKINEINLPQAEKISLDKSFAGAKVGDGVATFDYTVVASFKALTFSEQEIGDIAMKNSQFTNQSQDVSRNIKKIDYVSVEPDYENNTVFLKVNTDVETTPNINLESLKKELLGKNEGELSLALKKYQSIQSVNVEFWPTFVTRIPQFSQRVKIEIQKVQ